MFRCSSLAICNCSFPHRFRSSGSFLDFETGYDSLDTVDYVTIAQNLMGQGVFSLSTSFPYIPTIRRPPLYSFFLAAVSPGLTAILLQVALDAACALGVYFLTLSAGRIKQALAAGLFYAFYPSAIVASCSLMSEALFSFTLVTAVVFLVLGIRRDAPSASIAGSVCLGLTILCRPIAGAYLIALVATLIASRHSPPPLSSFRNTLGGSDFDPVSLAGSLLRRFGPLRVRARVLSNKRVCAEHDGARSR